MKVSSRRFPVTLLGGALFGALFIGGAFRQTPAISAPVLDADDQKATQQLIAVLHRSLKKPNGDKINLTVVPNARSSEGYFSEVKMSAAPAQLKKKLRVTEFSLDARNVQVNMGALWQERRVRTLKSQTKLRVTITEDDLTQMLARGKHTKTMGLKIKFVGDKLSVTGNVNYALVNGPVSGLAKLRMMPDHKVNLDIISMKLRGAELPVFVKNQFASRINPIIDYNDLPFNPPFKGVKVVGNKAYLST
ncbi:DUF2993 domain-containing protein [bacterium]|nr:MAG: DUF2993 domain-containing protein [bacterium]